jgi:hypothetical protein
MPKKPFQVSFILLPSDIQNRVEFGIILMGMDTSKITLTHLYLYNLPTEVPTLEQLEGKTFIPFESTEPRHIGFEEFLHVGVFYQKKEVAS